MSQSSHPPKSEKGQQRNPMLPMMIIMSSLALVLSILAYRKGVALEGAKEGVSLLIKVGPILVPAFILAGMASKLIPQEQLGQWLGQDSGLKGLALGTAAGALAPGGPFVLFPILAVLLKAGTGVGVITAFLSSWALLGMHRVLAFELPLMGWRYTLCRLAASAVFPIVIGFLSQEMWNRLGPA